MSLSLPIPEPRAEDDEDVHWALSTASALWARGEPQEALKWLRRAAETASDANRDERSLELFKAAADFANGLQAKGASTSSPPTQPAPPGPSRAEPSGVSAPPPAMGARPPAPPARPASVPPAVSQAVSHAPSHPPFTPAPPGVAATRAQPPTRAPAPAPHSPPPPGPPPQGAPMHAAHHAPVHARPVRQQPPPSPSRPLATGTVIQQTSPAYAATQQPGTWPSRGGAPPPGPFQPVVQAPLSEALAPTVPHPSRPPVTDVDAALRAMERSVKTLASNSTYDDLAADDSTRRPARSTKANEPQRAKRRATRDGRKTQRGEVSLEIRAAARGAPLAVPPREIAIHEAPDSRAADPVKQPFADEGTLEQHATLIGMTYDLDEQTNVLTGAESNVVLTPKAAEVAEDTGASADSRDTSDSTPLSESQALVTARPQTERPPPQEVALRALSAYRVALHRPPQGGLEVKLLAPGEPTPAGRVGALLVPVDAMSSAALFDLLSSNR